MAHVVSHLRAVAAQPLVQCAAAAQSLEAMDTREMLATLRFGAERIFTSSKGQPPTDAQLDAIINRSPAAAADQGEIPDACERTWPAGAQQALLMSAMQLPRLGA